jgi:DNA-directed RNA polymerase specialized sigma subunit
MILPAPDLWLLERLFWDEYTEAGIAQELGLSQRRVSKRKQAVLQGLHRWLEMTEK